jgi:hypothetical protein
MRLADPNQILTTAPKHGSLIDRDLSGHGGMGHDRTIFEGHEVDLDELAELIYRLMKDDLRRDRARRGY